MSDDPEAGKADDRYYTRDAHGQRELVGLTLQETKELEELRLKWRADRSSKSGKSSYSSLQERNTARVRRMVLDHKHKRVWSKLVGAEDCSSG
jgi:hypothetical protein